MQSRTSTKVLFWTFLLPVLF